MSTNYKAISKFLSLILRHRPEVIGLELDENGWVSIEALIESANRNGKQFTLALIHDVVATSDKQRFAISSNGLRIRAYQGHTIEGVDLQLKTAIPPENLFHGTVKDFIPNIRKQGLQKRSRHHVHLSANTQTAELVAMRRGKPIILVVKSAEMQDLGYEFFLSENGVWLTAEVPAKFLEFPAGSASA